MHVNNSGDRIKGYQKPLLGYLDSSLCFIQCGNLQDVLNIEIKQGDNIQLRCIPFPSWNQSVVPCPVLLLLDLLYIGFSGDR